MFTFIFINYHFDFILRLLVYLLISIIFDYEFLALIYFHLKESEMITFMKNIININIGSFFDDNRTIETT